MPAKDPMKLYDLLNAIKSNLEDILQDAQSLLTVSGEFGGEIARIYKEQITQYFAPAIKKIINDENTPGSIIGLVKFTDSVPLALTRATPSLADAVEPIIPDQINLSEPATNNVDNLPQNASYDKGTEQGANVAPTQPTTQNTQVNENLEKAPEMVADEDDKIYDKKTLKEGKEEVKPKTVTVYRVIKTSTIGSHLGMELAKDINTSKGKIVGEFKTKEEAEERCIELNKTVSSEEKSILGTEYIVEEYEKPLEPEIVEHGVEKLEPSK